jgi:polysaccharide chain length determinant protein (PEP-CTERM system associated)
MLPNKKYTPADFLAIARTRGLLVIVPALVGLFGALLFSSRLPNLYKAETLLQIVPQKVPDRLVPTTVTIQTEDRIEALGQQVQSRTFLERLIVDLNLYPEDRLVRPMQDVVQIMRGSMELETVRPNRMAPVDAFYVRFTYHDPALAARATERIAEGYISRNARERGALAEGAAEFLNTQMLEAQKRLDDQDRLIKAFRERHSGTLPNQFDSNRQAMQNVQMQRQTVVAAIENDRTRKLMLERTYNDLRMLPIPVSPGAIAAAQGNAPTTMPVRQRLELERANFKQMQQRLTADHPDVRRARRQLEELEKLAAAEPPDESASVATGGITPEAAQRRSQISGIEAELAGLDRQIASKEAEERRLSGVIADYQARIEAAPGVESQWLALSRDYETHKRTFEELVLKAESAKAAVNLENRQVGEQFRVLDPARVPEVPVSPNRPLIIAIGAAIGLILGGGLAALLEFRDTSLRNETEVMAVLAIPVLANIPVLSSEDERRRVRRNRRLVLGSAFLMTALCVAGVAMTLK